MFNTLLNETPSRMAIGLTILSCRVLKSKALIRIMNSATPLRVGFTRMFTNCIVSVEDSLKTCESLYNESNVIRKITKHSQRILHLFYSKLHTNLNCDECRITLVRTIYRIMANFNDPICCCNNGMNSTSFYTYFVIASNNKGIQ